jgi:MtaA/CmuA family methyltransferase
MNSYQRFFSAIRFENQEVPVAPFLMTFAARFRGCTYREYCTDGRKLAQAQIDTQKHFQFDYVTVSSDAYREASAFGAEVNFPLDGVPYIDGVFLKDLKHYRSLRKPGVGKDERLKDRVLAVKILKDRFVYSTPVVGWIESPLAEAGVLRGPLNLMTDLVDSGPDLKRLLEMCSEVAIDFALAQVEAGADIIGMGEAIASLISSDLYREFSLPYVKKVVVEIKNLGVPVKYHTCGNTSHLLSLFKESGVDIVIIDSPVELEFAKKVFNGDVCIKGNLNPVDDLLNGTPDDIYFRSMEAIKKGGPRGFILSGGCEIPALTPHENLFSMIRAAREGYALKRAVN